MYTALGVSGIFMFNNMSLFPQNESWHMWHVLLEKRIYIYMNVCMWLSEY